MTGAGGRRGGLLQLGGLPVDCLRGGSFLAVDFGGMHTFEATLGRVLGAPVAGVLLVEPREGSTAGGGGGRGRLSQLFDAALRTMLSLSCTSVSGSRGRLWERLRLLER